jgi:ABC-type lipoprotein export system ATPase subunit
VSDPVLRLEGVSKTYRDVLALRERTLELAAGELVVLTGPSGSGKSTLLMIAGGWETPDTGGISVFPPLPDVPMSRMPWEHVGFVPQSISLLDELSIADNLLFGQRSVGGGVQNLLEGLDLAKFADRLPGEVSRGEQQRAAVGRALAARSTVILADEPTSHQDRAHATMVLKHLREAADRGSAVLIASHDPASADYADRTLDLGH